MQVVALPSHVSPASEIMHSFPALALDALLEEGSILGFHEAKLLSKLFQRRLLWYPGCARQVSGPCQPALPPLPTYL